MVKLNHPFLNVALEWSNLQGRKKWQFRDHCTTFFQIIFSAHVVFFWSWGDKRSVSKHRNKNPIRVSSRAFFSL